MYITTENVVLLLSIKKDLNALKRKSAELEVQQEQSEGESRRPPSKRQTFPSTSSRIFEKNMCVLL